MTCMERTEWKETYFDSLIIDFCKKYEFELPKNYDDFLDNLPTDDYAKWEVFLEKEYLDYAASYYDFMREAHEKRHYGWP